MPPRLASAARNYGLSALIAQRAVTEARKARASGTQSAAAVVAAHQVTNAYTSQTAVAQMLAEQEIDAAAEALLNSAAFTTSVDTFEAMAEQLADAEFDRLVESIVQDAGRAAESVAVAVRPDIYHVRFVSLPCCKRCAVLAGRIYRWSTGFERHPNCKCTMIPTSVASPLVQNPNQLVEDGHVRDLSKAEQQAIEDGADLSKIVNVRSKAAGLLEAGHALTRAGKPTPAGIYRTAGDDREKAMRLLRAAGYLI